MEKFGQQLIRKSNIRNKAILNMGDTDQISEKSDYMDEMKRLYSLYDENIKAGDENSVQNMYWYITGSKSKVFLKKVFRKIAKIFYGWLFFPIMSRQSHFNGKMVNSVDIVKNIAEYQKNVVEHLQNVVDQQQQRIDTLLALTEKSQNENISMKLKYEELHLMVGDLDNKLQVMEKNLVNSISYQMNEMNQNLTDVKQSVEYYHMITDHYRDQHNRAKVVGDIIDYDLYKKVKNIEQASENDMNEKLNEAADYYSALIQKQLSCNTTSQRHLIIIFCLHYKHEYGMEAIKNEAYDLFQLLRNRSIYDVKLVSLEETPQKSKYTDDIIFVDRNTIGGCMDFLCPSLIVVCESTPYNAFDYDGIFLKYHTLYKLSAQNPLQGFDNGTINELRHCCDYNVQRFLVESTHAYNVMLDSGFRNVKVSYPIIKIERIETVKRNKKIDNTFVIGFASLPMEESQYYDRGLDLLTNVIKEIPDVTFRLLWRNTKLSLPLSLQELKNCDISYGKYDMKQFYQEVDCVIIPYQTYDNNHACSLSAVEAMINNIPVISTEVAGISEILDAANVGIVCKPTVEDILAAINELRNNYDRYIGHNMTNKIKKMFDSRSIIQIIEDTLEGYFPKNFITLADWDACLKQYNKYLVKGHEAIKTYYQNEEIANSYNKDRFLQYPANYFDAFERATIRIAISSMNNDKNREIMDIASGDGRIVQELIKLGICTSIDSSKAMQDIVIEKFYSTGKLKTRICDYFSDDIEETFDIITAFRYIRHYDYHQRKVIYKKLYNNLKDNGLLLFDAPNIRYAMKNREQGNWYDFNIYDVFFDEDSILVEMEENNFRLKCLIPVGVKLLDTEPVSWTVVAEKK